MIIFFLIKIISLGGKRKYYNLTDEGKDFLEVKKKEWRFIKSVMNQFLGEVE